jgi:hypothetical protein
LVLKLEKVKYTVVLFYQKFLSYINYAHINERKPVTHAKVVLHADLRELEAENSSFPKFLFIYKKKSLEIM